MTVFPPPDPMMRCPDPAHHGIGAMRYGMRPFDQDPTKRPPLVFHGTVDYAGGGYIYVHLERDVEVPHSFGAPCTVEIRR